MYELTERMVMDYLIDVKGFSEQDFVGEENIGKWLATDHEVKECADYNNVQES